MGLSATRKRLTRRTTTSSRDRYQTLELLVDFIRSLALRENLAILFVEVLIHRAEMTSDLALDLLCLDLSDTGFYQTLECLRTTAEDTNLRQTLECLVEEFDSSIVSSLESCILCRLFHRSLGTISDLLLEIFDDLLGSIETLLSSFVTLVLLQ